MPINANLLGAMARPVRSVADYHEDYDRRDMRAQGMQRNALLMAQEQRQQQQEEQAAAQAQQSQNALMAEMDRVSPGEDPRLQMMQRVARATGKPMDYLNAAMPAPKAPTRHVVNGAVVDIGPDGKSSTLYQAPEKKPLPPEIVQLIDYSRSLPPGDPRKVQIEQAIQKQLTHAPAPSAVSYGSPVPIQLEGGGIGYAQPGNKPGAQPQVMTGADGRPLIRPPEGPSKKEPMSVALQKELMESDDSANASRSVVKTIDSALKINESAYSGYGAKARAVVRSNLPGESAGANATIDLDNMVTGQALESLKLVFGGMPTEGERKILLEMQASADKTPTQRKAILDRARAAAERRGQQAAMKAKAIRDGTYLTHGAPEAVDKTDKPGKAVKRTGTSGGRKVVEYTDGSIEYAD